MDQRGTLSVGGLGLCGPVRPFESWSSCAAFPGTLGALSHEGCAVPGVAGGRQRPGAARLPCGACRRLTVGAFAQTDPVEEVKEDS
eukprot:4785646-Amphidinium_carterae.2